ncbi:MAG: FG-GAP-like repeat-containing protein, partial [Chloroflexota bacterium]|nr:FG-GAP-like repeat-containing protein [Chloroflexota bacterium]
MDSSPFALASGDFNQDGNPDLVSASNISSTVSVLLGSASGAMGPATDYPVAPGSGDQSVAVGDFNLDGNQDLVTGNLNTSDISVLLGNGSGSFGAASVFTAGTQPVSVAVGDFNNDGKPDVVVANFGDDDVSVRLNTCAGSCASPSFTTAPDVPVGNGPYFIVAGHFNADANLDFATANNLGNSASVLLGNGSGGFTAAAGSPNPVGSAPEFIAAGDLDNDGDLDLVTANRPSHNVSVLLNDGTGDFAAAANISTGANSFPSSVGIGDFNEDGNLDLAVTLAGGPQVGIMLGDGTGSFQTPPTTFATGGGPNSIVVRDFDSDGLPDIALANSVDSTVSVYINGCSEHTPTPTVMSTSTDTAIPSTSTATGTPVPASATATPTTTSTATSTATSTSTRTATSTGTVVPPSSTASTLPSSTSTSVPSATSTAVPASSTATRTATAVASSTVVGATSTVVATATVCTVNFPDNQPGDTFYEYIQCLACRGIVTGYPDGMFHAERNITRGQISKMVSNAAGFNEDPGPQIYQ